MSRDILPPRSAPGLPTFPTPAAAAEHYREALGITGEAPPGSAWRLAAHLAEQMEGRLEVLEWGAEFGWIAMFANGKAWIFLPSPGIRPEESREAALLHELGHTLLTWRCEAFFRLAELKRRGRSLQSEERRYWEQVRRQGEALADGFVAAWRAGG